MCFLKELSKNFITLENLDAAIEYALANPVDYNFSIDLQGNMYKGRNTLPPKAGKPTKEDSANVEQKQMEASNWS